MTDDRSATEDSRDITEIAHEYIRAVEKHEALTEEILAEWAEDYYRPGYLDDEEWALLKDLLKSGDDEHALMQVEIAAYRKAATEVGREDEFDDDWPAKNSGGESDE